MWWTSAVVVDLPLVPVMPTTLCGGSSGRARANSSMSPMISTPASRARWAIGWRLSGRPGVTTRLSNWVEVGARRGRRSSGAARAAFAPRASSLPSHAVTFGAARQQRLDRRQPRAREAVDRVMLAGEGPGGDHRSFSVARPASASTKLMIQKRITTVGSDQPRCSKWWWIGAIRNTRLPVRL